METNVSLLAAKLGRDAGLASRLGPAVPSLLECGLCFLAPPTPSPPLLF